VTSAPHSALVVDDEQHLRELVRGYLEREGFAVHVADNGRTALELARQHEPTVVVLDLMLPEVDGLEVCRRLRTFSDAYVIMLTARAEEIDRIIGLEVGADDYLTKPFSPRELVARVRAMLRRPREGSAGPGSAAPPLDVPPPQHFGDLTIDHGRREVSLRGAALPLTPLEFALLTSLAAHPGRVFTRAQLLERVWGQDYFGDDHVVDVHIANLRKKLGDDPAAPRFVETVRGVGYRFAGRGA
jgi:DNA-binding response OmpR family regulator